jgi:hypothetical protein
MRHLVSRFACTNNEYTLGKSEIFGMQVLRDGVRGVNGFERGAQNFRYHG